MSNNTTTNQKGEVMTFTHTSYAEAQAQLKRNKRNGITNLVTWDAGDGWKAEGYFCPRRNRIITGCSKGIVTLF